MKITSEKLAQILFVLILLAVIFSPNRAKGQNVDSLELGFYFSGNNSSWVIDVDSIQQPTTKTDTIDVRVLCEVTSGRDWLGTTPMAVFITKSLERTFETKTLPYDCGMLGCAVAHWGEQDIIVSSRWLHSIEGCYSLFPITQNEQK